MSIKTFALAGLIVFVALGLSDLILTQVLIEHGGGKIYEGNPLAGLSLARFGWTGLATYKMLSVMFVGGVSVVAARQQPRLSVYLLSFACLASASVIAYSWHVMESMLP
jgi:Domain of unknown function (DUF5658)